MKPRALQAEQAAELLGIDMFYLARALRHEAQVQFERQAKLVGNYTRPNFGDARRIMWAAEACEEVIDMGYEAREELRIEAEESSPA